MQSEPILSIVTPTFNCKSDLDLTLTSIREQNWNDLELIVVDGGSSDGTTDVVKRNTSLVTSWVSEPDKGIYDAMNKGIERARGHYLQFLNAGDLLFRNDVLARVCSILYRKSPDAVFGRFHVTDSNYETIYDLSPKQFSIDNLKTFGTGTVNHQAMFIRRSIVPYYSLRYRLKGELNWYLDIIEENPSLRCVYLDFPAVKYKVGGAGNLEYKRNLLEWIALIQRRFGTVQNMKNIARYRAYLRYIAFIKQFYV